MMFFLFLALVSILHYKTNQTHQQKFPTTQDPPVRLKPIPRFLDFPKIPIYQDL
ncbi:hypothetical protein FRX31_024512, partial [Thalictrum thalictroides]